MIVRLHQEKTFPRLFNLNNLNNPNNRTIEQSPHDLHEPRRRRHAEVVAEARTGLHDEGVLAGFDLDALEGAVDGLVVRPADDRRTEISLNRTVAVLGDRR